MKNIASALVKAQKAFGPALKTNTNPHFKSKYADLSACVEAVIDALNNEGIALIQQTHDDSTGVTVETMFLHESGESLTSGKLHVPASKQDPQGYGSALTYARRYSLMAACGIAPEDDDGNAASQTRPNVDYLRAIKTAKSLVALKNHFAAAWKMASADEKDGLKQAYDDRTEQLTRATVSPCPVRYVPLELALQNCIGDASPGSRLRGATIGKLSLWRCVSVKPSCGLRNVGFFFICFIL